jgi:hypothetical protein
MTQVIITDWANQGALKVWYNGAWRGVGAGPRQSHRLAQHRRRSARKYGKVARFRVYTNDTNATLNPRVQLVAEPPLVEGNTYYIGRAVLFGSNVLSNTPTTPPVDGYGGTSGPWVGLGRGLRAALRRRRAGTHDFPRELAPDARQDGDADQERPVRLLLAELRRLQLLLRGRARPEHQGGLLPTPTGASRSTRSSSRKTRRRATSSCGGTSTAPGSRRRFGRRPARIGTAPFTYRIYKKTVDSSDNGGSLQWKLASYWNKGLLADSGGVTDIYFADTCVFTTMAEAQTFMTAKYSIGDGQAAWRDAADHHRDVAHHWDCRADFSTLHVTAAPVGSTAISRIEWNLDDLTFLTGKDVVAPSASGWQSAGTKNVTVTVTSSDGGIATRSFQIVVSAVDSGGSTSGATGGQGCFNGVNSYTLYYAQGYNVEPASTFTYLKQKVPNVSKRRLPVGSKYWTSGLDQPLIAGYTNSIKRSIANAWQAGISTIVDIHDFDSSEHFFPQKFGVSVTPQQVATFLGKVAGALKGTPGYIGLDFFNEPFGLSSTNVTAYYSATSLGFQAVRAADPDVIVFVESPYVNSSTQAYGSNAQPWVKRANGTTATWAADKIVYEAHSYPISTTPSGTTATSNFPVTSEWNNWSALTQPYIDWLNKFPEQVGMLGETGFASELQTNATDLQDQITRVLAQYDRLVANGRLWGFFLWQIQSVYNDFWDIGDYKVAGQNATGAPDNFWVNAGNNDFNNPDDAPGVNRIHQNITGVFGARPEVDISGRPRRHRGGSSCAIQPR